MPAGTEMRDVGLASELSVLLVAEEERLGAGLAERLKARAVSVETADVEGAAAAAYVGAPDLVVLAGRAAQEPDELLAMFAARAATSTLPIVIVSDPHGAPVDRSVFRHGVVAVIDRSASADEMAREVERLARELPEREGSAEGPLASSTIEDVIELLSESLRSGVLSVESGAGPRANLVVRADRPLRETLDELVARLRALTEQGDDGSLRYRFDEAPGVRISSLDVLEEGEADDLDLAGWRLLLVERNPARADVLAQALRSVGAMVAVVDGEGEGLALARELMPEVLLIDDRGVEGWATGVLRAVRHDPWLRWASLLVMDSGRLWADPRRPDLGMLGPKIRSFVATDAELARRVQEQASVLVRLDLVGPVRLLRLLGRLGRGVRLVVNHPRMRVEVDLAEGLIAGATVQLGGGDGQTLLGAEAIAILLGLHSGRVRIVHVDAPRTANVMSLVDDALLAATSQPPLFPPSLPPPSARPSRPAEHERAQPLTRDAVDRLEALLKSLVPAAPPTGFSAPPAGRSGAPAPVAGLNDETPVQPVEQLARPNELTGYEEVEDGEPTGQYAADMVDRLRRRMKNSERLRAAASRTSAPPHSEPRPAPLRIPPPSPKRPLRDRLGSPSKPQRPAVGKGAKATDSPPLPPAPASPARAFPRPKARMSGASDKPKTSKSVRPPPPTKKAKRRRARREPTLMFGSAVAPPSSDDVPAEQPDAPGGSGSDPEAGPRVRAESATGSLDTALMAEPTTAGEPVADSGGADASLSAVVGLEASASPEGLEAPSEPGPPPSSAPGDAGPLSFELVVQSTDVDPALARGALDAPVTAVPGGKARSVRRGWMAAGAGAAVGVLLLAGVSVYFFSGRGVEGASTVVSDAAADPDESGLEVEEPTEAPPTAEEEQVVEAAMPSSDAGHAEEAPDPLEEEPSPAGTEDALASEDGLPAGEAVPEESSASATDPPGPGPDEPLRGSDDDWEPVALGIEVAEVTGPRRRANRQRDRLIREANRLRREERLDEAEAAYMRFVGVFPDDPRGMAGLARVHLERGEPARSIVFAQRLTRIRPRFASNYLLLGDVLLAAGNDAAARRAFQEAVRMEPRWPPPRQRLVGMNASE